MQRIVSIALLLMAVLVGYNLYRAESQKARADELQTALDRARAACNRVSDLIPAESRPMWPADATPEERLTFVLDQKQREIDARSGSHYPGGARLGIRFLELPVACSSSNANSQRQVSLATQE